MASGPNELVCQVLSWTQLDCAQPVFTVTLGALIIGALIGLIAFLLVWSIRHYSRLDRHDMLLNIVSPYGAAPEPRVLRLNPYRMAAALGERGYDDIERKTEAAKKLNEKYNRKYFVVEFRESGRRLFQRELHVIAWPRRLETAEFQVDAETLAQLKAGSASKLDDDTNDSYGADGEFDIFLRPVRWWDFRHWLNHPSREIRYALYVGIFAAGLEYSGDIVDLVFR